MMLEDDLRATLAERAATPVVQPDLLDGVRGGIRRSNRRRAAVLGAAALLVAAIAVPVALRPGPAPAPVPQDSTPPGWQRPRLEPPAFPLTPGRAPAGFGAPFVGRLGPAALLSYEDDTRGVLSVEVGPKPGAWEAEGDGHDRSVTVGGRTATLRTVGADIYEGSRPGDEYVGLRWQLADGRWVQLISSGPRTETEVLRFARALRPGPVPASPVPFTVATAPAGLALQLMTAGYLCLAPATLTDQDSGRGICLGVSEAAEDGGPGDEQVSVAGRPATMALGDQGPVTLTVGLGGRRYLTIDVAQDDVPLTRDELISFAEGVTVR